jgi:hypothetical protein
MPAARRRGHRWWPIGLAAILVIAATLLRDAGAGTYDSVDVRGAGLRDGGRLTLTLAQVKRKVQLDFSDRGTVKVCGPNIPWADWVRDVISLDAR